MKDGFIKCAAAGVHIKVADPVYNAGRILEKYEECIQHGAKLIVFPELCLTGYTCNDLFLQETLLNEAKKQLFRLVESTKENDALVFIGLPFVVSGKLYNVAAAIQNGKLLALIPKTSIPNYAEFYEARYFVSGYKTPEMISLFGNQVPFGTDIILESEDLSGLTVACEICEDVWSPLNPGTIHALNGANILVNLSASNETIAKNSYRNQLVSSTSARLVCGYVYASAGDGESTQDLVFAGHHIIAENGKILTSAKRFDNETIYGDIDCAHIQHERRRMTSFQRRNDSDYVRVPLHFTVTETDLERKFHTNPFVPSDMNMRNTRCEDILSIQANGLKKRYEHTGCQTAVIGVSGGLDSTLALLVTVRAFDLLNIQHKNIMAITMPCFGTTDRTYENACRLAEKLGCTLKEINIKESVSRHFKDINQDENKHDVTYENGQARERTQVLMDIANQCGGLVIGTGDMSELALGWATYNGDHMSMYGVNAGVPKTLVRHLVQYYADTCERKELQEVLLDVLDTPVSPELLPPVNGTISQKTEDLVGPYELHDFFLYYMLRMGFPPLKIYRIAKISFKGLYDEQTILKWMKIFYKRFFAQQFKRSCIPDGPKVGSVALSPRGDLRMPSDASCNVWLSQLEDL